MKLTEKQRNSLESSTSLYEKNLSMVLPYLESRGITEETARHFRLGFVGEPAKNDTQFSDRLCIPYLRRAGVVGQRFRALGEEYPKYDSRTGAPTGLYNVEPFFSDSGCIGITEGELDTVVLHQLGVPSVGIPGAQAWKPHFRRLFEDFERIVIFQDNDYDNPVKPGKKLSKAIRKEFPFAEVHIMPTDDVNGTFLDPEYGPDYLRSLVYG